MSKIIKITKDSNEEFYVFWELTDFCNQKCSYCPPDLHEGKVAQGIFPGAPTDDEIDKFLETLEEISKSKNVPLRIVISGGEPTLHHKLPEIITKIKSFNGHITIATNGTRNVSYWKELPTLPDQVVISIHPEYYESKQHRINELANFLDGQVNFFFYVLAQPTKWDNVMGIINDLDNKFKPLVELKPIHNKHHADRELCDYSVEQLDFIKNYPTKLKYEIESPRSSVVYSDGTIINKVVTGKIISNNEHYFLGWMCEVGVNNIAVNATGQVTGGVCGVSRRGHISNFTLNKTHSICVRPSCTCPSDVTIDKYDPKFKS